MASDEVINSIDVLEITLGMIGKEGPIVVDIGMAERIYSILAEFDEDDSEAETYRRLAKLGKIAIGTKGEKITLEDTKKFVKRLKKEMTRKEYNGDYFFSGIRKTRKGYQFIWSS